MANRQTRNPGDLQTVRGRARVSASVPNFAVDKSAAAVALANAAGSLSSRLKSLADNAAAREGALAGLEAGQASGASYLKARQVEAQAEKRKGPPSRAQVSAPAEIRNIIVEAAKRHGVDPEALLKIAELESSFNPSAKNPNSSAGGLFQFLDGTASDYGLVDRFDPVQSADAAARLARDNAALFRQRLGRNPTRGELYLAHQQGAGGATKLLANPNAQASEIVGADAVRLNGGNLGMSASQFAHMWIKKAGGGKAIATTIAGDAGGLSLQPLQLRRDGTIRGDAADQAAIRAFSWRLEQRVSADLAQADIDFGDSPVEFASRLREIQAQYIQDPVFEDPQTRELFESSFQRRAQAYRLKIAARQETLIRQEELAATNEGIEARRVELERQAYALGANPDGDAILADQLGRAGASIDGAIDAGTLTATQGSKIKAEMAETVARARVRGTFDALPSAGEKEQFALALLEDWSEGEGPLADLPFETVKSLSTTLFNGARAEANRLDSQSRARRAEIQQIIEDDVASIAATGQPVDLDAAGIDLDEIEAALTPEEFQEWKASRDNADMLYQATAGMEAWPEAVIAGQLETIKPKPGQPGFEDQQQIYTLAQSRAAAVLEERKNDPIGQAIRAGITEDVPIDTSSAEALDGFLYARARQANAVQLIYKTPFRVFRPGEAEQISTLMLEKPELLPIFAAGISSAFGKDAPKVLSEISANGPVVAHAAGIGLAGGEQSVAMDVSAVLSNRAAGVYKLKMPSQAKFAEAAGPIMGDALRSVPDTAAAAIGTAALLYERTANAHNFDPDDLGKADSPASQAWQRALNRALGARFVDGQQYGGIGMVRGRKIIVPSNMPIDRPAYLLGSLTDEDLERLPPIATANDIKVSARQVRRGQLVTAGDGLYRVALGDPDGPEPRYLATPDGRFWLLDLKWLNEQKFK